MEWLLIGELADGIDWRCEKIRANACDNLAANISMQTN
jgi:hypothetical protein